jgi:ATP-dependent Zn protease
VNHKNPRDINKLTKKIMKRLSRKQTVIISIILGIITGIYIIGKKFFINRIIKQSTVDFNQNLMEMEKSERKKFLEELLNTPDAEGKLRSEEEKQVLRKFYGVE